MKTRGWLYPTILLLLTPLGLFGDGVLSTNSCLYQKFTSGFPSSTISQIGSASCAIDSSQGAQNYIRASTDIRVTLPAAAQPTVPTIGKISESVWASADLAEVNQADAFGSFDYSFTTAGPIRSGFLYVAPIGGFGRVALAVGPDGPGGQDATAHVIIGPLKETCDGDPHGRSCSGNLAENTSYFPFTLGQNFLFHEDVHLHANSDLNQIQDGSGDINISFLLFESDGVTPVPISLATPTPEPASALLWAGGLLALLTLIPRSSHREE